MADEKDTAKSGNPAVQSLFDAFKVKKGMAAPEPTPTPSNDPPIKRRLNQ